MANKAMRSDEKVAHVLISFSYTYSGDSKIPSRQISNYLAQAMPDQDGRHLERITTYSTGYHIMPSQCGLRDAWNDFTDEEREGFVEQYPDLATAIALMCGDGVENADARSKGSAEAGLVQGQDGTDS